MKAALRPSGDQARSRTTTPKSTTAPFMTTCPVPLLMVSMVPAVPLTETGVPVPPPDAPPVAPPVDPPVVPPEPEPPAPPAPPAPPVGVGVEAPAPPEAAWLGPAEAAVPVFGSQAVSRPLAVTAETRAIATAMRRVRMVGPPGRAVSRVSELTL